MSVCPLLALSGHRQVHCKCLVLTQSGHSIFKGKTASRAAVLLNKASVAKAQRVLMRIEAGCPDSLKRLTGVIFVPLTFRIERS